MVTLSAILTDWCLISVTWTLELLRSSLPAVSETERANRISSPFGCYSQAIRNGSPCNLVNMLCTKNGLVAGVQQVNNDTLERDIGCLFQCFTSLGAQ